MAPIEKRPQLSEKDIEALLHHLGLHTWDQGDDTGFGGEWVVSQFGMKKAISWFKQHGFKVTR